MRDNKGRFRKKTFLEELVEYDTMGVFAILFGSIIAFAILSLGTV